MRSAIYRVNDCINARLVLQERHDRQSTVKTDKQSKQESEGSQKCLQKRIFCL